MPGLFLATGAPSRVAACRHLTDLDENLRTVRPSLGVGHHHGHDAGNICALDCVPRPIDPLRKEKVLHANSSSEPDSRGVGDATIATGEAKQFPFV